MVAEYSKVRWLTLTRSYWLICKLPKVMCICNTDSVNVNTRRRLLLLVLHLLSSSADPLLCNMECPLPERRRIQVTYGTQLEAEQAKSAPENSKDASLRRLAALHPFTQQERP